MSLIASAITILADIAGFLILGIIALGVFAVVQLLFLPKTDKRSRHLIEEERRRAETPAQSDKKDRAA